MHNVPALGGPKSPSQAGQGTVNGQLSTSEEVTQKFAPINKAGYLQQWSNGVLYHDGTFLSAMIMRYSQSCRCKLLYRLIPRCFW